MNDGSLCYFHPGEVVVGVCALCLNERLLILASKQGKSRNSLTFLQGKAPRNFQRIFSFGSLLNRFEAGNCKSTEFDVVDTSAVIEDSYISMKLESNGALSLEKTGRSEATRNAVSEKSVIQHSKPRRGLRWSKPIGDLFQLIMLKRPVCHVGSSKVEGVSGKTRRGERVIRKRGKVVY